MPPHLVAEPDERVHASECTERSLVKTPVPRGSCGLVADVSTADRRILPTGDQSASTRLPAGESPLLSRKWRGGRDGNGEQPFWLSVQNTGNPFDVERLAEVDNGRVASRRRLAAPVILDAIALTRQRFKS